MDIQHALENSANLPLALTIGNFDGVHVGHQAIFTRLTEIAQAQGLLPAAMTFLPHAKVFFGLENNFLINSDSEKAALIAEQGIKRLYQIPFDADFSALSPTDFLELLIHSLKVKYVLVGDDFRFGHKVQGDFSLLKSVCQAHDVTVEHTPTVCYQSERVSSSRVRNALLAAEFDLVCALLGRPLQYRSTVITGQQLGRTIDFPTANMRFNDARLLPAGVFAVRVTIDDEPTVYQGMCNIGVKPTVNSERVRQMEVHLFDFTGNLYGKILTVEIIKKIRDEQKFTGIDELISQLQRDKRKAQVLCSD